MSPQGIRELALLSSGAGEHAPIPAITPVSRLLPSWWTASPGGFPDLWSLITGHQHRRGGFHRAALLSLRPRRLPRGRSSGCVIVEFNFVLRSSSTGRTRAVRSSPSLLEVAVPAGLRAVFGERNCSRKSRGSRNGASQRGVSPHISSGRVVRAMWGKRCPPGFDHPHPGSRPDGYIAGTVPGH